MPVRGRGRGRGGGGRGRGRGGSRGGHRRPTRTVNRSESADAAPEQEAAFEGDFSGLLGNLSGFAAHLAGQEANKYRYVAALVELGARGVEVPSGNRVRGLAAAWARKDWELADLLLSQDEAFGVVEVLKALCLLDAGRSVRAVEKRVAVLKEAMKTAGPKGKSRLGRRLVQLKKDIHNLSKDKPPLGTASGALARHVRRWTRGLSPAKLEFYALHMPRQTWVELADKVHLHPEKDFPQLPWFLRYCYDSSAAPDGTLVAQCRDLTADNVNEKLRTLRIPFSHLKALAGSLDEVSKTAVARYTEDLDTLLWNYEELECGGVDGVICERLDAGETVRLGYGKLMERLLHFSKLRAAKGREAAPFLERLMPLAEARLGATRLKLEEPVVVVGDASASMDVAIQTSTIIASFLRAATGAQLVFFSSDYIEPPYQPQTIEEVLRLALATKTVASTNHASALLPFYLEKKIVKTFIITTDEEENSSVTLDGQSLRFLPLFKKYQAEVYPAKLVFVSFLRSQHAEGQMVGPLRAEEGLDVLQFKLDSGRPDLTKLDHMVGQLSEKRQDDLDAVEARLRADGLSKAFNGLTA